jgi:hypothetical protein
MDPSLGTLAPGSSEKLALMIRKNSNHLKNPSIVEQIN